MSLKLLAQLSHFITMMFGVALGISMCIWYQFKVNFFIDKLTPFIISLVIISGCLRIFTLVIWKKNNYHLKFFDN
ncbi:MAG: hypothetical protein CMG55_09650 [Candidatus Marinimicrobia bacterium]|nr:hypothetical protein [Candidatus Neomarinimicrobiota bacterium]|tara:strand:- start:711 stop:935 length:225 start_codon:yes stop_codon:yes gene_type:complete